jgi:hypothetical protein
MDTSNIHPIFGEIINAHCRATKSNNMKIDLHGCSYNQYPGGYKISWNGKNRQLRLLKDKINDIEVLDIIEYDHTVTDRKIHEQIKLWEGLISKLSRKCYYCSRAAEYEIMKKFICGVCLQGIADESECTLNEFEKYKIR